MESLAQDIRMGIRSLVRRPLFTGVAVLTLGLGIGATTMMFGVVETVLRPDLPYPDADRLVTLWQEWPGYRGLRSHINLTDDQYRLWRDDQTLFQDVAMFAASEWDFGTLTQRGRPSRIGLGTATASLRDVLGVRLYLGRWFLPEEEGSAPGEAAPVAVLSYKLWQNAFGGMPETVGKTIVLDGMPRTIVGILAPDFQLRWLTESPLQGRELAAKDIWVPYGQAWDCVGCGASMYQGVGRLKDGVTLEQAQAETQRILAGSMESVDIKVSLVPRDEDEVRGLASPLLLLLGGTVLLLLIACGNIATLSVSEIHCRRQELRARQEGGRRPYAAGGIESAEIARSPRGGHIKDHPADPRGKHHARALGERGRSSDCCRWYRDSQKPGTSDPENRSVGDRPTASRVCGRAGDPFRFRLRIRSLSQIRRCLG